MISSILFPLLTPRLVSSPVPLPALAGGGAPADPGSPGRRQEGHGDLGEERVCQPAL